MKSKIFFALSLTALVLCCLPSASGQTQLPTSRRPVPGTGQPKTGTVTGGLENVVNSKLMIYTRNGTGTTNTNMSGEFPSQLAASATVNGEFTLVWSRTKAGKVERGLVYIRRAGTQDWVRSGGKLATATLGAAASEINIPISMPNYPVGNYELKVVGDAGSSSKVAINYQGNGGSSSGIVATSSGTVAPPGATKSSIRITSAKFTPMVGSPGEPGYKRARLVLNLRTDETTTISKIDIDVLSEPWSNPELVTSANTKNSPIVIFNKKWTAAGGSYQIVKGKDNYITVVLRRNSKNDVEAGEGGPGFYSAADWAYAFAQTTDATFRWKVDGKIFGSATQSPKKEWQWGAQ